MFYKKRCLQTWSSRSAVDSEICLDKSLDVLLYTRTVYLHIAWLGWLWHIYLKQRVPHHQQRNNSINDSLLMLSLSYDFQLLLTLCLNSCHEQAIRVSRKGQSIIPRLIVKNTSSVCLRRHVFVPIVTIYYKLKNINFNTVVILFYVYRYLLLAMEVMTLFIHCSFIPEPNSEQY